MKKITLTAALAVATLSATAATTWLTSFKMRPALELSEPMLIDSIDAKGNKYDPASLLNIARTTEFEKGGYTVVKAAADTLPLTLSTSKTKSTSAYRIYDIQAPLRAERFAKGTLKVESPLRFKLFVDGKEMLTATEAGSKQRTLSLTLHPQADYDITLRLLDIPADEANPEVKVSFEPDTEYADITINSSAEMPRRFSIADTEFSSKVTSVSVSPDGNWLLYTITTKHSPEQTEYNVALRNLRTGNTIELDPDLRAQWMPRSSQLTFSLKNGDYYDIYSMDPATLKRTLRAKSLQEPTFFWNSDESKIYYYVTVPGPKDEGPLHRIGMPDDRIPGNKDVYYVMEYDPATAVGRQLTSGSQNSAIYDFHPTKSSTMLVYTGKTNTTWPFVENSLFEYDTRTGAVDTIAPSVAYLANATYSPDGSKILILAGPSDFDGIGNTSGYEIPNDFDMQLFIYDRKTRNVECITKDFDPAIDGPVFWNKADGKIYMRAAKGFTERIFSYDPSSRKFAELPLSIPNVNLFSVSNNAAGQLAYVGTSTDNFGEGYTYNLRTGKETLIANPDADRLGEIEMSKYERWTFTATESGSEIEGYAIYPPDYDPAKKYPLIVYYYGGTLPTQFSLTTPYNPQLAAARGYMVYMLNPSGTTGYGQEFSARHVNAWGKYTAQEIIEGTKKFCEAHPAVDTSKIGCIGASYGGFMTQYLQTLTDIFACAVSHAGISNVTSYWGEGYWGYSYNAVAAAKSYPWTDPELFTKQGSLFNADKIHTPLLLLHGTADTNVPIGESIQLFNALRLLGREVEFVTVEGENHIITDYNKRRLWNDTYMAWFAKWLQDDPRWWNSLYPDSKK